MRVKYHTVERKGAKMKRFSWQNICYLPEPSTTDLVIAIIKIIKR
jgi:hypothetical protein